MTRALAAGWALRALPVRACQRLMPRDVIGFCYHTVATGRSPHVEHLFACKTAASLAHDLAYLGRHYTLVGYDALRRGPDARARRPRAVVTFDDGYAECHGIVRPLLLRMGIPAIFFVTTAFIDNHELFYRNAVSLCIGRIRALGRPAAAALLPALGAVFGREFRGAGAFVARLRAATRGDAAAVEAACGVLSIDVRRFLRQTAPYLSAGQIDDLAADGFTIGAHGRAHDRLGRLPPADAERDIVESCATVRRLTGAADVPFAFPFHGRDVSRATLRAIRARHAHVGLFFDTNGLAADDDCVVNRIFADTPGLASRSGSNLPRLLRGAFVEELLRGVRRKRLNWRPPPTAPAPRLAGQVPQT